MRLERTTHNSQDLAEAFTGSHIITTTRDDTEATVVMQKKKRKCLCMFGVKLTAENTFC